MRTDAALCPVQLNWADSASKHQSSTCAKIKVFIWKCPINITHIFFSLAVQTSYGSDLPGFGTRLSDVLCLENQIRKIFLIWLMLFPVSEFGCHTQSESQITVNNQGFEIITKKKKKKVVWQRVHIKWLSVNMQGEMLRCTSACLPHRRMTRTVMLKIHQKGAVFDALFFFF